MSKPRSPTQTFRDRTLRLARHIVYLEQAAKEFTAYPASDRAHERLVSAALDLTAVARTLRRK